jgi:transposase-like protein
VALKPPEALIADPYNNRQMGSLDAYGFTVYQLPKEHWRKIRTSNGMERLNREVKRRTRVAVLFPNKESALRLVTGVIIEIHEEWVTGKIYLDMNPLLNQQWKNE